MNVTLFFLNSSPDFNNHIFFPPIFGNDIATINKKKISPTSAMPLPQFYSNFFFPSHFWQWHCPNYQIFFFPISAMALPQLVFFFFRHGIWAAGISITPLPKFKIFSLSLFLFLSHTFVEFQQRCCRNLLSFLISLNKLEQYL